MFKCIEHCNVEEELLVHNLTIATASLESGFLVIAFTKEGAVVTRFLPKSSV